MFPILPNLYSDAHVIPKLCVEADPLFRGRLFRVTYPTEHSFIGSTHQVSTKSMLRNSHVISNLVKDWYIVIVVQDMDL